MWDWDAENAKAHFLKHKVSFGLGTRVFDDPRHYSEPDPHPAGNRWRTIGLVGDVVLFVVHTDPVDRGGPEPVGTIISVRKASPEERLIYVETAPDRGREG